MDVPYLSGRTASPLLYQQEQQGDNYDYSNNDLHNVINIGRDARNVIISRRKECKEIEAYSPSSNYRITAKSSVAFKKQKPASTRPQGKPRTPHHGETSQGGDRINKTLLRKCFMHPKSSHTIFECNSLRKALGAPLLKETLLLYRLSLSPEQFYSVM